MKSEAHSQSAALARLGLAKRDGAIVVVDLVASVRQIEQDEFGTITRWVQFMQAVKNDWLNRYSGRLVKSLGDGLLLEFPDAAHAILASLAIMDIARRPEMDLMLRIGVEAGSFLSDIHDVYGVTVNRAARLMIRAAPGQVVVSQAVRDAVADTAEMAFYEIGVAAHRSVESPIVAFAVDHTAQRKPGLKPALHAGAPTLAIIPFETETAAAQATILGDVLCEELIAAFLHTHKLNVIARQSTAHFRHQTDQSESMRKALQADYIVTGTINGSDGYLALQFALHETQTGICIATDTFPLPIHNEFAYYRDALQRIQAVISAAINVHEIQRNRHKPLEQISSHSLLLLSVDTMHQFTFDAFSSALQMLNVLQEREPGHMASYAWRAHWHHLRIQQGWSPDIMQDMRDASDACKRAVDRDPDSSLALAVGGLMATVMERRSDLGAQFSTRAVANSPNDPRAWLYHGAVCMFADDGPLAVQAVLRARYLSPLDPYRFMYDSITASAYFVNGEYLKASEYAQRAYSDNKNHASTLRVRAASLLRAGRWQEAQVAAAEMMRQDPSLTISGWKRRSPAGDCKSGQDLCAAFAELGVPP